MSVERAMRLVCDAEVDGEACGNLTNYELGGSGDTVAKARAEGRHLGWHRRPDGRDVCPLCWTEGSR